MMPAALLIILSIMIKLSIMYRNEPGIRFDLDYYRDKHLPMIQSRLGKALVSYTLDKGLMAIPDTNPPEFVAIASLYFDSVQAFERSIGPHIAEFEADLENYSNVQPVRQISEVIHSGQ